MTYDDLAAARREWLAEDEAMRNWLGAEPQPAGYVSGRREDLVATAGGMVAAAELAPWTSRGV